MRHLLALILILLGGLLASPATAQATRLQEPWRWTGFTGDSGLPWTDILHVTEVLSHFPWARSDERFRGMLDVLTNKLDDEGRVRAESVWQVFRPFDFGHKREASPTLTWRVHRVLRISGMG